MNMVTVVTAMIAAADLMAVADEVDGVEDEANAAAVLQLEVVHRTTPVYTDAMAPDANAATVEVHCDALLGVVEFIMKNEL